MVTHVVLELTGRPWRPPLGPIALHSCDRPVCVAPWHLSWGTSARNNAEMVARGRQRNARGMQHPRAKLTAGQVQEARQLYAAGEVSRRDLARRFGVAASTMHYVLTGKTWADNRQEQ